jgi:hypothetical protein
MKDELEKSRTSAKYFIGLNLKKDTKPIQHK